MIGHRDSMNSACDLEAGCRAGWSAQHRLRFQFATQLDIWQQVTGAWRNKSEQ